MRKILIISLFLIFKYVCTAESSFFHKTDVTDKSNYLNNNFESDNDSNYLNVYKERLIALNAISPIDLSYNENILPFIKSYLGRNKALISKMLSLKEFYFPLFEQQLDFYNLPLELKYLAIVESALNPKARSPSGATGLWQFMYLTGKDFGLDVNSYFDQRQDPLMSTKAACEYFVRLYDMFGDWHLVLAAYNGGPGYLQRKINSVGSYSFWDLYPHLRQETRNYIPTFIAVNYVMNYAAKHGIESDISRITISTTDTLTLNKQISLSTLSKMLCINVETINFLNPSFKKDIFPANSVLVLPLTAVRDFLDNEEASYMFIESVAKKEILIDEKRIIYQVVKGDYLGRIADDFDVKVFEIKKWNNLTSTDLIIGDKLVIYVNNNQQHNDNQNDNLINEYIVQPGDTLWDIAKKYKGVSVWKIMSLNNIDSDNIKPGTKILLPTI